MAISQPISAFTQRYFNHIHFFTYIFIEHLRFSVQSLGMCYQKYNAMGRNSPMTTTTSSVESQSYHNQFQLAFNKITTTSTFSHILLMTCFTFSMENLGHVVSKPQYQKRNSHRTRERTHQSCECHIMIT